MQVAWAGVAAQLAVLVVALAARLAMPRGLPPAAYYVAQGLFTVFIGFNIFLMIVALLPIGPFDGHAAWRVFALMRDKRRKKARRRDELRQFPERALPEDKRRELEENAAREAADLIEKLSNRGERRREDA
jgi:hypothetical protein